MKMIKTFFVSCFFILTMSLTGCLTIDESGATINTDSSSTDSSSSFGSGDGLFGTSIGDGKLGW